MHEPCKEEMLELEEVETPEIKTIEKIYTNLWILMLVNVLKL